MKGKRKIILALVIMLIASICGVGIITAGAEEPSYNEAALNAASEALTNNDDIDHGINDNLLPKTVDEFIAMIKNGDPNFNGEDYSKDNFAVLTAIIPYEAFVREPGYEYLYCGKEYLFYLRGITP